MEIRSICTQHVLGFSRTFLEKMKIHTGECWSLKNLKFDHEFYAEDNGAQLSGITGKAERGTSHFLRR